MNKSSELETKIAKINKDASLVDRLEDKLDSLNNFYHELEEKLEGLNGKEKELADTITSMHEAESFAATLGEKLEELRHEFVQMDSRNGDIIGRLKHVEANMQKIEGGEDLIEEAVNRFKEMDGYTRHIEERLGQLDRARKRLDEMEVNLEKLSTATQSQIEKLMAASSIALDPHSGPLSDALPDVESTTNEKRDLVLKLSERSWTEEQIAKQLKMSVSEVRLIISSARRTRQ
jgi:chromosome segregation ATPase